MRRFALLLTLAAVLGAAGIALAGDCQLRRAPAYVPAAPAYTAPYVPPHHDEGDAYTFFVFTGPPTIQLPPVTIAPSVLAAEQQRTAAAQQESSGVLAELRSLRQEVQALRQGNAPAAPRVGLPPLIHGAGAASPAPAPEPPSLAQEVGILQARCAECHSGNSARGPRGRAVQLFNDQGAFELRGTTFAAILDALDGDYMPRGRPPLTAAEKATIKARHPTTRETTP